MESTPDDRLCDICATIPFLELHAKAQEGDILWRDEKPLSWSLGQVSDVRGRRYCPFCRLTSEGLPPDLADDSNLEICWGQYRYVFSCSYFPPQTEIAFLDIGHRFLDKRIDIPRVRQWLSTCSEHHLGCYPHQSTLEAEIPSFRVIDVPRRCITAMPNSIRYVALSYVWGQVDTYRLLKGNYKDMMRFGGLTRNWKRLPRTIRDVILFTEAIGERYLWIDTLCLIQDDNDDKIPGIKHMDIIYSRAFCTIIAASGEDANAGIPGWGLIRRRAQRVSEVHPGINAILTQSMTTYMRQTRYEKRAWTFQEYFLPPRRIIFVNSQAYYVCRECYWREDDAERTQLNSDSWRDESYLSLLNSSWMNDDADTHNTWTMMLYYYTKRELTCESDMLNAMAGICRALSIRCKCTFFQGMPVAALDLYMLFDTVNGFIKKSTKRRRGFPSYSWAGWHGQIRFRDPFSASTSTEIKNNWLSNQTWIDWYKHEPSTGAVTRIWDVNQNPDFLEATEGDIGYRNIRSFRPKSRESRLYLNDATTHPSPRYHAIDQTQYPYPLLQFWTVSVYFSVTFSKDQEAIDILDRNGDYCGYAYQNAVATDTHIEELEPIELVILSECWKSDNRDEQIGRYELRKHMSSISANEEYSREFEDRNFFMALWIHWDGDVAERVGIAQIFQAAMEESLEPGPVWKEILLG
ncbi:hypothetical protein CGCSCA4_v006065 [Colletotrichum siamense]|uniref:Heterokaryon incompatibility domain-containing protein n=1 Tax=Colletotrichum siamense TaxID=690259 RepID=A0A9P5BWY9_COLSI|nr:hypothetical protein CGCSCA4_v006065 [Colletotrichum siamense]KAF4851600.1 hypothetical protein CGCSCA2_v010759 [Colletotrichum siamense]